MNIEAERGSRGYPAFVPPALILSQQVFFFFPADAGTCTCTCTDCNPLIRFGLVEPSLDCFSMICMASAGYHAVRRNVRKTSFKPVDMELSSSDVRRFWTVFAEAYAADAREHNASCTKFSVPGFLNSLIACNQTW